MRLHTWHLAGCVGLMFISILSCDKDQVVSNPKCARTKLVFTKKTIIFWQKLQIKALGFTSLKSIGFFIPLSERAANQHPTKAAMDLGWQLLKKLLKAMVERWARAVFGARETGFILRYRFEFPKQSTTLTTKKSTPNMQRKTNWFGGNTIISFQINFSTSFTTDQNIRHTKET